MTKLLAVLCLTLFGAATAAADTTTGIDIERTVVKMPLAPGVSMDDAVESMKLRANMLNMMFVAHQPLSKQLNAMGFESKRVEIFQFCDPITAGKMIKFNSVFAAYMPCRIALVEEADGRAYLLMLKLDMLIAGAGLSEELKALAVEINDKLMEIMTAGANGEL